MSGRNRAAQERPLMSAIVKEIGHRQVYDILQSRKPRAAGDDLWGKRFSGGWLTDATAGGTHSDWPGCASKQELQVLLHAEIVGRAGHRCGQRCYGHERHHRRKRKNRVAGMDWTMPGHGVVVPAGAALFGGARGCRQRSKVSMTTMCPPQHGHGERASSGSSGTAAGGGATPSNSRARSRCALRVAPASRP